MRESPDKSFLPAHTSIADKLTSLEEKVDESSIPHGHRLRRLLVDVNSQLADLVATDHKAHPALKDTTPVDVPKMMMPKAHQTPSTKPPHFPW